MRTIRNKTFKQKDTRDFPGKVFENLILENCTFDNCCLSIVKRPEDRTIVRNVVLKNCHDVGCGFGCPILEDVTIDGLRANDLMILWGPLFKHVTLKGKINQLKVNLRDNYRSEESVAAFSKARESFYRDVDWALDISEAVFTSVFELEGCPSDLVRRDTTTQAIVRRGPASKKAWRKKLSADNTWWPYLIDMFLDDSEADHILVVPKGMRPKAKFEKRLAELKELRDLGVVELE